MSQTVGSATLDLRVRRTPSPSVDVGLPTGAVGQVVYPDRFQRSRGPTLFALQEGDEQAWSQVFDRHAAKVRRTLTFVLGPDAELADLTQEVFLEALRSIASLRGDVSALEPWLMKIAVFTARRCIRRRRVRRIVQLSPFDDRGWEAVSARSVEPSPELGPVWTRVRAVLDELPLRERVPFVLRFVDELSLDEVAAICEVSLATAKRRLVRARERFERLAKRDRLLCDFLEGGAA